MKSEKPVECVGCNTFDVGSILDNSEVTVNFDKVYPSKEEAEQALAKLIEKARETENEPCQIQSEILAVENGYQLKADFTFGCQAEVVIFQLNTRTI